MKVLKLPSDMGNAMIQPITELKNYLPTFDVCMFIEISMSNKCLVLEILRKNKNDFLKILWHRFF